MTTATKTTPKAKTVRSTNCGEVLGKTLYATPTGLKLTARGKVEPAGAVFAKLSKGEARKVRKALHRAGKVAMAAEPRQS